jgi:flagellar basal body rod protein FlgB
MVEAILRQPDCVAAKKTLDAVALRQEVIASSIANLELPGYKRLDLVPAINHQSSHSNYEIIPISTPAAP